MTEVHVSRYPSRSRFESVQFGNASPLDHNESKDNLSPLLSRKSLQFSQREKDFLSPLAPGDLSRFIARRDRHGSVSGLSIAYKRRTRQVDIYKFYLQICLFLNDPNCQVTDDHLLLGLFFPLSAKMTTNAVHIFGDWIPSCYTLS